MHRLAGSHQQLACRRISPGLLHRICALSGRRAVSTGAAKGNKGKSSGLGHIDPEYRNEVANILERAESSLDAWEPTWTKDFYPPPVIAEALALVKGMALVATPWGGHPRAERARLVMARTDLAALLEDVSQLDGVRAVNVAGNFVFDAATHRDFLGASLGTGLDRGRVGDILVNGERGAHLLVAPDVVQYLEDNLTQVRTVSVETREIPLSELRIPQPKVQEMTTTEASLRLDAVASAGFRLSRSAFGDSIKSGDVRLNWRAAKATAEVASGDMIACTGKGRLEVGEISTTAKGRFRIQLTRFL